MASNWTGWLLRASGRRRNCCKYSCSCWNRKAQSLKLRPIIMLHNKSLCILQMMIMTRTWHDGGGNRQQTQPWSTTMNACCKGWLAGWMDGNWKDNPNCIVICGLWTLKVCCQSCRHWLLCAGNAQGPQLCLLWSWHRHQAVGAGNTQRHNSYNYGLAWA